MLEFDDSLGTTKGTFFSVVKGFSSHLWSDVAFHHWPTHMNNGALRRAYPDDRTAGVSSSNCTVTKR